jgi:hypothetical protein
VILAGLRVVLVLKAKLFLLRVITSTVASIICMIDVCLVEFVGVRVGAGVNISKVLVVSAANRVPSSLV